MKEAKTKSVILLNSLSECMKVITLLEEAGKTEEVDLRYRGETCPFASPPNTGMLIDQAHKVLLLSRNTLVCRCCGKMFRIYRRTLSERDRAFFSTLLPGVPFGTLPGTLIRKVTLVTK